MCWHVTLNPGISVDKPGASDVVSQLVYFVFHQLLKLGAFMLQLVCKYEGREARSHGHNLELALWSISRRPGERTLPVSRGNVSID
jgi:hypothetical protein